MKYRIRIFADFCDGAGSKQEMEAMSLLCKNTSLYGNDKDIYITDGDDYTHVIIWNTVMPIIKPDIPKENVIGFAYEPLVYLRLTHQFIEYARKYINKYYIGDVLNLPEPFVEGNGYLIYNPPLPILQPNVKLMSLMISQKLHQPGHKYRHELASAILRTNLPIDIYGRGCGYTDYKNGDSRIKGGFEKYELYDGYQFHICIENVRSNHYFSEKIINALMTNTTPIYLGCVNIDSYFPNNVIHLSGVVSTDMQLLENICREPDKYIKHIDVDEIEQKVSLLNNLANVFTT